MKVMSIVGARPQFVKLAMVSRALKQHRPDIAEFILHTGQHFDNNMSQVFFDQMQIPSPHQNLNIGGGSYGQNTGRMLEKIEACLREEKPDWVIVYGDTDSTLAGALAAAKLTIPIAHVESGLRSGNMSMPEEINRVLTDAISSLLFCPSQTALSNLSACETRPGAEIVFSGDVMFDAVRTYAERSVKPTGVDTTVRFILVTFHRAENTDSPENLQGICEAIEALAKQNHIILPLHPRTHKALINSGIELNSPDITLLPPATYYEMLWLLQNCEMVLTDSGGLQKEAYFHNKPCVILRSQTEWLELLATGSHILAGADTRQIVSAVRTLHTSMAKNILDNTIYGSGDAAKKIVLSLPSC